MQVTGVLLPRERERETEQQEQSRATRSRRNASLSLLRPDPSPFSTFPSSLPLSLSKRPACDLRVRARVNSKKTHSISLTSMLSHTRLDVSNDQIIFRRETLIIYMNKNLASS